MYSPILWKHLKDPRNRGALPTANAVGESRYPKCGDHLILQIRLTDDRIAEVKFLAKACGHVIAAASYATELLVGLNPEQARALSALGLDRDLGGFPPSKRHAILLILDALFEALQNYEKLENENA